MVKHIKSVIVLTSICIVVALLMAVTNEITAPIIAKNDSEATKQSLSVVMPDSAGFEKIDISLYQLPETVEEVYSADNGGYVIKVVTTGYASDMTILCGINSEGSVTGAVCLSSNETLGYEKEFGQNMLGVNSSTVDSIDTISGATKTTEGYINAIRDALETFKELKGNESLKNITKNIKTLMGVNDYEK